MRLPTASALDRVMACPASHVLPAVYEQTSASQLGTAVHHYIERARASSKEVALAEIVDAKIAAICEAFDLSQIPERLLSEVAFAWDSAAPCGGGWVVGQSIGRNYPDVAPTVYLGTADLFGLTTDGRVVIADFKTGRRVRSARESWQMRALALLAATACNASAATATLCYIWGDHVFTDTAEFDALDLASFAAELRSLAVQLAQLEVQRPEALTYYPAEDTCRYCPGFSACRPQVSLARAVAYPAELPTTDGAIQMLTPAAAGEAWKRLQQFYQVAARVESALRAYARQTPIPLGHGKELREVSGIGEEIDPWIARDIVARELSAELAAEVLHTTTSKAAIALAATKYAAAHDKKAAPIARRLLTEIGKAGGITTTQTFQVKESRIAIDKAEHHCESGKVPNPNPG